ncbi:MAG: hypothetical protein K8S27_11465 [Candidatus Omnitrophica bacterium]|nr:hypothetical protein [Candidatus Omnitrophota bacterium]
MLSLKNKIKKSKYNYVIHSCQDMAPYEVIARSQQKALKVFKRAAENVELYQNYLQSKNVSGKNIDDIAAFKSSVPVIDKHSIFHSEESVNENIFLKANQNHIQSILLSSGSTGTFSFGISTPKEIKKNNQFIEVILDYYFNILDESSLIINCLSQSVKLPMIDTAAVVETGPRIDSLLYILQTLASKFSQIIIIGDNYFIKNALEAALKKNIPLGKLKIHIIVGGAYLPEKLRTHLTNILEINQHNRHNGSIFSSMGISEFGLNLFFESPETVRLRQLTLQNPSLKEHLLYDRYPYIPMFFNYFPQAFFLEEKNQDIIITSLTSALRLPLIRYNTKDKGHIIPYSELNKILKDFDRNHLLPPFKSPLVIMYGKDDYLLFNGKRIYPQQISEGLFTDFEVAISTTGNFRLSQKRDKPLIEIQLKKNIKLTWEFKIKIAHALLRYIEMDIPIKIFHYQDFPYGMELDYERKFKYI